MTSSRRAGIAILATAMSAATVWCPAGAAKGPWQLSTTFTEPLLPAPPKKGELRCSVAVAAINDERREPKLAGVIRARAIHAPADPAAWGRAVLNGLNARGFTVRTGNAVTGDVAVTLTLQTVWVTETGGGYSSNAVARVVANGPGGRLDNSYRGRVTRTNFWSGGGNVVQSSIDGAWSKWLDALAPDLRALCGARVQPSS